MGILRFSLPPGFNNPYKQFIALIHHRDIFIFIAKVAQVCCHDGSLQVSKRRVLRDRRTRENSEARSLAR